MSILNVNQIQPVGGGNTITVNASDVSASGVTITASNFVGPVTGNISGGTVAGSTGTFTSVVAIDPADGYALEVKNGNTQLIGLYKEDASGGYIYVRNAAGTSNISLNGNDGDATFKGDLTIADKIIHDSDTDTAIRFPAADTFSVETAGSEALRVDSSQRLLLGNTSSRSNAPGADVGFQIEGASGGPTNKRFIQYIFGSGDGSGPYLGLAKHRGTSVGGNTIVVNGDELGGIYFQGADGTNFKQGASILGFVDGTPGSNDMPGRLSFQTTSDGASSPTERLRITSAGAVTKPFQPLAIMGTTQNNWTPTAGDVMPFNYSNTNRGNHYNTSNYTFTCPVTGDYMVILRISKKAACVNLQLSKNGTRYATLEMQETGRDAGNTNASWHSFCYDFVVPCSANDTLRWEVPNVYSSVTTSGSNGLLDGYNHIYYDSVTYYLIG